MYRILAYLKFIFSATNQHGVHSPFLYDYVTECLYHKPNYEGSKTIRVLLGSIKYYNVKNVCIISQNIPIQNLVKKEFPKIEFEKKPCDLVYLAKPNVGIIEIYSKYIHNNTLIIINSIHADKENNDCWEQIKILENITVTVDMYYCGAIFFRREQAKQHFKIRI